MADYADIPRKADRLKMLKTNPYYNALQVKFAYSLTCHKTQGGQWNTVFVDQGFLPDGTMDVEYLRWLYTAITRATHKLYLLNFNDDFFQ
jgi:exodeoxyribonuclease-5